MKIYSRKKRPFILLEVLIAIAIVSLAFLPLLAPQVMMYREETKLVEEVELDRLVNFCYADILEQLYRTEISWETIISGEWMEGRFAIRNEHLEELSNLGVIPFLGFRDKYRKGDPIRYHYVELNIVFFPGAAREIALYQVPNYIEQNRGIIYQFYLTFDRQPLIQETEVRSEL